jgi:HD-GYP domain-containing protein (c-di-GMP phosphodiesterase class II)
VAKTVDVSLKCLEKVSDPEGNPLVSLGQFRVNGLEIDVQSLSPLATLQEEEEILNLMRYSRHMMEIKGPEMLETVLNTAEYARKIATHLSLPAGLVPTEEQSAQIQQNIIGMAQQQLGQQTPEAAQ